MVYSFRFHYLYTISENFQEPKKIYFQYLYYYIRYFYT